MAEDPLFLGSGWSFPPTFKNEGKDLEMVSGADDINQCLTILLSTSLKERLMNSSFGCNLMDYQFEEIDQALVSNIKSNVQKAIRFHEPRINLDAVNISLEDLNTGLIFIHLFYTVRTTNSRFNMVYPFYLKEANSPV